MICEKYLGKLKTREVKLEDILVIRIKIIVLIMTSTISLGKSPTSKHKYPTLSPISTPFRRIFLKVGGLSEKFKS